MTDNLILASFAERDLAPTHRRARAQASQTRTPSFPRLALLAFVGISSACASCAPSGAALAVDNGSGGLITISPTADTHIGPQDDFDPVSSRCSYVIANDTAAPLSWEVRVSAPWLTPLGPASGVLASSGTVAIELEVERSTVSPDDVDPVIATVDFVDSASGALLGERTVTIESSFLTSGSRGWTTFTPSVDTRTVYVSSSSGDDQNDGLSTATPKFSVAAGRALLRQGFPDWLLLQRGDTWHESLGQWKTSGRSASEPMLVSTYGSAPERPRLETGTAGGVWTNNGGGSPATIDNVAFVGLHFRADAYTGGGDCVGALLLQPGSHLLIEDCAFEGYGVNLVFQGVGGRHSDFRLRRSVIVDAWSLHSVGGHSQGLYVYAVDGLLVEENVFDHNGWNEDVPGAGADIYNHNLYIDNDNSEVVVRGNLIANGSSHGLQLRCGGTVLNNLFVRNSIALLVGGGNDPAPGGVLADVRGNVILEGKNIDAANPRGWGVMLSNVSSGNVAYNIVANNQLGTQPTPLVLDGDAVGDDHPTIGVHDTALFGNIFYDWGGALLVQGDSAQITDIDFSKNDVQDMLWPSPLIAHAVAGSTATFHSADNRFFNQVAPIGAWAEIADVPHSIAYWAAQVGDASSMMQPAAYVDPTRSVASYSVFVGGRSGLDDFLAEARLQSRTHWRPSYAATRVNRYIRAGF